MTGHTMHTSEVGTVVELASSIREVNYERYTITLNNIYINLWNKYHREFHL